jgi:hypothetical protein
MPSENNAAADMAESREFGDCAALDIYPEYDESLVERDGRQRLMLAWMQDKPPGRLH